jgi:hypothetical protein
MLRAIWPVMPVSIPYWSWTALHYTLKGSIEGGKDRAVTAAEWMNWNILVCLGRLMEGLRLGCFTYNH